MVSGLLMELDDHNCWTIAEAAGHRGPHRLQHLLSRAVWDDQQVADIASAWAAGHLDDGDAVLIVDETADEKSSADCAGAARRRSDHHRLGFAVQLGTVRAVGRFLEDPLDVPWSAVEFLPGQLGIGDASCVKKYVQRPQTPYEHAWEIRDRYGYQSFDDQGSAAAFARFLDGRAWTHTEGPVPLSQVRQRVRPRSHSSATRIAEVLAELGMRHDDTTAAIRAWIDRRTGELPAGFGRDVRAWLVVLLDGDGRTRPRSPATVHFHFGRVRPFIECWAATRGHLREMTSGDVDTVLEPLRGHRRYNAITALRSLFRFAKRRGVTFADPTAHLRGGRAAGRTMLPMTAEEIRTAGQAAATPAQRLAIALAAVHAARPGAIRGLTLEDIDLPSRRISIAGHRQRLGELTRNALLAWLGYRRATWPDTANRHVLITRKSALGTGPVSAS
jgi:Domain of unknown function (DUF4158)/DDE superfamily endonuclease